MMREVGLPKAARFLSRIWSDKWRFAAAAAVSSRVFALNESQPLTQFQFIETRQAGNRRDSCPLEQG